MAEEKIVYVNKTINDLDKDYLGMQPQVDSIITAVDKGAKMVGVIADYGSGKSSLAELVDKNAKNKKVIKVNMWGDIKGNNNDNEIMSMDKSLLYQIAKNSKRKNLAKHVNKRLNPSNGFISIALKSRWFWFWFVLSMLCVLGGVFLSASNFTITLNKELSWTFGNGVYVAAYLVAAILLAIGIIKAGGIAYSSWKSEGEKKFDESNLYSIFDEIIEDINSRKQTIIVVEDLDRINEPELVLLFIKEIYRFSSLCKDKKIVFMVAIKPKAQLIKDGGQKKDSKTEDDYKKVLDYEKIFDYIVELKPIHIQDFDAILKSLINEEKEKLHKLLAKDNIDDIYSDFSILAEGENLTIRILKHRLNNAILLYESIKNRQSLNNINISIRTCCIVSYLQSQYEKEYYLLVNTQSIFPLIISESITLLMDKNITKEIRIDRLRAFIKERSVFKENKNLNDLFFSRLAQYIINGYIKSDYREYFYSYPKGSYIQCEEETELQELLLYPYDKNIVDDRLNTIVNKNIELGGKILRDTIIMIEQRGFNLPLTVIRNEKLLEFCYVNSPQFLIKTLEENLLWTKDYSKKTVDAIVKIINYKFDKAEQIIKDYVEKVRVKVGELGQEALDCRCLLSKEIKERVVLFKDIYFEKNSPVLVGDEINILENEDILFELIPEEKASKQLFIDLSNRKNHLFNNVNKQKLEKMMELYVKQYPSLKIDTTLTLLSLLTANQITNDNVFTVITTAYKKNENHKAVVEYLNSINDYSTKYLEIIDKLILVDKFNETLIKSLFENKYYKLYLFNVLYNKLLLTKQEYDIEIFNSDIVGKLFSFDRELFSIYRETLLKMDTDIKENYKFVFSTAYPFVSEEEKHLMAVSDCIIFFNAQNIEPNIEAFIQLLIDVIKSSEDVFEIANYILSLSITSKINIFSQLPFKKYNYCDLDDSKRVLILDAYKKSRALNSESEILKYMELTGDVNDVLENELMEFLNKYPIGNMPETILNRYVALLNEHKKLSNVSHEILSHVKYLVGLCKEITDELIRIGDVKEAIISSTIYNNKFDYNPNIDIDIYYDIYTTVNQLEKLMQNEHEFLVKIYQCKMYEKLSYEQLLVYNSWGHNKELILAVFDKAHNDEERKNYFMNIPKMENEKDCDALFLVFKENNKQYEYLLKDKDICDHAKFLAEKSRTKGFFTRYFNKLRESITG